MLEFKLIDFDSLFYQFPFARLSPPLPPSTAVTSTQNLLCDSRENGEEKERQKKYRRRKKSISHARVQTFILKPFTLCLSPGEAKDRRGEVRGRGEGLKVFFYEVNSARKLLNTNSEDFLPRKIVTLVTVRQFLSVIFILIFFSDKVFIYFSLFKPFLLLLPPLFSTTSLFKAKEKKNYLPKHPSSSFNF